MAVRSFLTFGHFAVGIPAQLTLLRRFYLSAVFLFILLVVPHGAQSKAEALSNAALRRCSSRQVGVPQKDLIASDGDHIYVGTTDGLLASYSASDLGIEWKLELGGEFASQIAVLEDGPVVVTNTAGETGQREPSTIRSIAKDTGVAVWSHRIPFSEKLYLGMWNGGLVVSGIDGTVTILDPASGRDRSQFGLKGRLTAYPAYSTDQVAFGLAQKQVALVTAREADPLVRVDMDVIPRAVAFTRKGNLLAGDERGNVHLFSASDNKTVWKFKTGAAVSSLLDNDAGVLVTSLDNFVYLISDYNGDVIWKRRLPGRVTDAGIILDGYFVVLVSGENSGYVLDLHSGRVVDTISIPEGDLISGKPILIRGNKFALLTAGTLQTFAMGNCSP